MFSTPLAATLVVPRRVNCHEIYEFEDLVEEQYGIK
jgi:hypothetical protein